MKKDYGKRVNIIGAGEAGYATVVDLDENNIFNANSSFGDTQNIRVMEVFRSWLSIIIVREDGG